MADAISEHAARRAGEADFIIGGQGAKAKRARRQREAEPEPATQKLARKVYMNVAIFDYQRKWLDRKAFERFDTGQAIRFELSIVLRDLLDYCRSNEKEVTAWIAKQNKGRR
jgi:hypothetical protein